MVHTYIDWTVPILIFYLFYLFIQAISIAPLQVNYYSEALPTQHGYCVGVLINVNVVILIFALSFASIAMQKVFNLR